MVGTSPRRRRAIAAAIVLASGTMLPWAADGRAAGPVPTGSRFATGWSQVSGSKSLKVLDTGAAAFGEISPFAYNATGATTLTLSGSSANMTAELNLAKANNLPVLVTVTDGMGKGGMAAVLDDPAQRAAHVQALVDLVNQLNASVADSVAGVDLDYENFAFSDGSASWAATKPDWIAFVKALGDALHAQGRLLSITVPPIWNQGKAGYPVYAWSDIIGSIDRLRLMVYEWSGAKPGPGSPMSWVNDVIDSVLHFTGIPANQLPKVQIGVPAYGKSWTTKLAGKDCPASVSFATKAVLTKNLQALADSHQATLVRDASAELTFTWDETVTGPINAVITPPDFVPPPNQVLTVDKADIDGLKTAVRIPNPGAIVTCSVRHTVYAPDTQSIIDRANVTLQAGLSGIAIWALGYESDDLGQALVGITAARSNGTAPQGSFDGVGLNGDGTLNLNGWVRDPEIDLPLDIQVQINGGAWSNPVPARTPRDDVGPHGLPTSLAVSAGAGQQVCIRATGWGAEGRVVWQPATPCRTI